MHTLDYLQKALQLAEKSFEHGEFPAGAVVVTKNGEVFESGNSFGWNHAEAQVVDKALAKFGPDLASCTLYTTMQPCVGCASKIYWGGIRKIVYIISKDKVNPILCYEGEYDLNEILDSFHEKIIITQDDTYLEQALGLYKTWEKKIGF